MSNDYSAHCRRSGCTCDHLVCYMGWRDTDKDTTPCHYCRPQTFERWHKREQARAKGYPLEALSRIMRGDQAKTNPTYNPTPRG